MGVAVLVGLLGLGATVTDFMWFATAQKFFNAKLTNYGVEMEDYVGSDQPRVLILVAAMSTLSLFIFSVMRFVKEDYAKKFEGALAFVPVTAVYAMLAGTCVFATTIAYAYSIITLSKFEPLYEKDGGAYSSLKWNSIPSASAWMTLLFVCGSAGYTLASVPILKRVAGSSSKSGGVL